MPHKPSTIIRMGAGGFTVTSKIGDKAETIDLRPYKYNELSFVASAICQLHGITGRHRELPPKVSKSRSRPRPRRPFVVSVAPTHLAPTTAQSLGAM